MALISSITAPGSQTGAARRRLISVLRRALSKNLERILRPTNIKLRKQLLTKMLVKANILDPAEAFQPQLQTNQFLKPI